MRNNHPNSPLVVTRHALERFRQRAKGSEQPRADVEIGNMIIEKVCPIFRVIGDAAIPIGFGLLAVVKQGAIVTVRSPK